MNWKDWDELLLKVDGELAALRALRKIMVAVPDMTAEEIILAADAARRKPYLWLDALPAACKRASENDTDTEAAGNNQEGKTK